METADSRAGEGQDRQVQRTRVVLRSIEAGPLGRPRWRISPDPFWIDEHELGFYQDLGGHLLKFYQVLNHLYRESAHRRLPLWFSQYLDQGKPSDLVGYGLMNRIKSLLPGIIRPDILLTGQGMVCTELDAVPGGFGMTACLAEIYAREGFDVIGGADGIVRAFAGMIRSFSGCKDPNLAIVVSDESGDYRPEMAWLSETLRKSGLRAQTVKPEDLEFAENGLYLAGGDGAGVSDPGSRIDVVYRFFELFDLKNIPKSDLFLYAARKGLVSLTPPVKAHLEEKLAFALFHHPIAKPFWIAQLGEEGFRVLSSLFPKTWILDPREVPPHAVIPDLVVSGRSFSDWESLGALTQRERHFVIKPSGFSELAWGGRGVTVGHDVSEETWRRAIRKALADFYSTPHILQEFHKGRRVKVSYDDGSTGTIRELPGRVRLCPYYFVISGRAELAGILATVCPLDKKLIHGMTEAVMMPCALRRGG